VQGYAYAAFVAMSGLAAARNDRQRSAAWQSRAEALRAAIERRFWVEEMRFYAIAIAGDGEPCCVPASNAGHLLLCGVPSAERAAIVAAELLSSRFASGWGIRTLAEGTARFNPMSYHNGSIWPHDTSLCAAGMARYGARSEVVRIMNELFEAANHFAMRLPELYCGFERRPGQGPVAYPVACLPQAWSSGSVFMLLQASLGIRIDGARRELHIGRPQLPHGVEWLRLRDLAVNDARIDLEFHRIGAEVVAVPAKHTEGNVRVLAHL
jgi:glycogen debranching enzyme